MAGLIIIPGQSQDGYITVLILKSDSRLRTYEGDVRRRNPYIFEASLS
jgi:hypothetical protein